MAQTASPIPRDAWRQATVAILAIVVLGPLLLVAYQSLLNGPFFLESSQLDLGAYRYRFCVFDVLGVRRNDFRRDRFRFQAHRIRQTL